MNVDAAGGGDGCIVGEVRTASPSVLDTLDVALDRLDGEPSVQIRRFLTALNSLPTFVFELARTLDEHDADIVLDEGKVVPGKPFPDWRYLHALLDEYADNRLLLVEKARQLMVTWLFAAVVVWEVRRRPSQRWGWVSLKEDHADQALERMWTIIERLPGEPLKSQSGQRAFRDAGGALWTRSFGRISLPMMAGNVHAMSQSADDCRSFTFSGLVFDEFAFMPKARDGYTAAKPTIDKGRAVGITTAGPFGFVCDLFAGKEFGQSAD